LVGGGGNGALTVTLAEVGAIAASASKRAEVFLAVYFGGSQMTSGELSNDASGMTTFSFGAAPANNHFAEIFLREAPGPATGTYGMNGSVHAGWRVLGIGIVDGVDVTSTLTAAVKATNTGTGTGSPSCPSVTGAAVGDFHIIGIACNTGGGFGTQTPPAGYQAFLPLPEGNWYYKVLTSGDLTGSTVAAQTITTTGTPASWVSMSCVLKATSTSNPSYRYYRFRSTESAVSDTMTAAEINLLDGTGTPLTRTGWTLGASSSFSGNPVSNTTDGSTGTFWETDWSQPAGTVGAKAPPYHWQADLGAATAVSALRYTPRGGSMGNNGAVGYFDIYGSNDGSAWTLLTGGYQPAFSAIDGNATIEIQVSTAAVVAATYGPLLGKQQRWPGFPPTAPPGGIARLGMGVLAPQASVYAFQGGGGALSPYAVAGTGAQGTGATGTAALSPFDSAGLGLETFAGTVTAAFSAFAVTAVGLLTFVASGTASMSPFACSGSGAESFACSGTAAMSQFAASASGTVGTYTPPPAFWAQAQPRTLGFGPARLVMPIAPMLGLGLLVAQSPAAGFVCSGSAGLSSFATNASGAITFVAIGSVAMSTFACAGTGVGGAVTGSGSAACAPFGSSASGLESFSCSGSAAMRPFASSGNGALGTVFVGSGSAAFSAFAVTAIAVQGFTGTASALVQSFAVSGAAFQTHAATGTASMSPFASTSIGFVGDFIGFGSAAMAPFAVTSLGLIPITFTYVTSRTKASITIITPTSRSV